MGEVGRLNLFHEHHGAQCFRGEISLTFDELSILQNQISPDFRFVPVDEKTATQPPCKKPTSRPGTLVNPKIGQTNNLKENSNKITTKKDKFHRTKKPPKFNLAKEQTKNIETGTSNSNSLTDTLLKNTREFKGLPSTKINHENTKDTINDDGNTGNNPQISGPVISITQGKDPESQASKLVVPTQIWTTTCKRISEELKKREESSWFLMPVIPERDGVPDYLTVITHPMDLKTIESKLSKGTYRSPYEWQQDIRQIFYNAFKYHVVPNQVWHDALKLAEDFEAMIHNLPEISIYGRFNRQPNNTQPPGPATTKPFNPYKNTGPASHDKFNPPIYPGHTQPPHSDHKKVNKINEIENPPKIKLTRRGKPVKGLDPPHKEPGLSHPGDVTKDYQIPNEGIVPKPPPEQKIGVNDKSLNNNQKKTLLQNLSRLAPNQRLAALELIQDDLGILAEKYASDTSFSIDPELLSIEKQKRIQLYVNQMIRENIEMLANTTKRQTITQSPNLNEKSPIFQTRDSDSALIDITGRRFNSDQSEGSYSSSSFISSSSSDSDSGPEYERDSLEFSKGNTSFLSTTSPIIDKKKKASLPEYTPISEQDTAFQINEEIMGKHADFLGRMDTGSTKIYTDNSHDSKVSAWADWKGQVIKQGIVSQREDAPTRSRDEIIAESYDARI